MSVPGVTGHGSGAIVSVGENNETIKIRLQTGHEYTLTPHDFLEAGRINEIAKHFQEQINKDPTAFITKLQQAAGDRGSTATPYGCTYDVAGNAHFFSWDKGSKEWKEEFTVALTNAKATETLQVTRQNTPAERAEFTITPQPTPEPTPAVVASEPHSEADVARFAEHLEEANKLMDAVKLDDIDPSDPETENYLEAMQQLLKDAKDSLNNIGDPSKLTGETKEKYDVAIEKYQHLDQQCNTVRDRM